MNRGLGLIGVALTLAYGFLAYLLFDGQQSEFDKLKPNEVGDFLAGIFGPLAVLWLILGFFQQGIELRLSRAALVEQAKELKASVAHQEQLVAVSRRQMHTQMQSIDSSVAERKRAAKPHFVAESCPNFPCPGHRTHNLRLRNMGGDVHAVEIDMPHGISFDGVLRFPVFLGDEVKDIQFDAGDECAEFFTLTVLYTDSLGYRDCRKLMLARSDVDSDFYQLWIDESEAA